MAAFLVAYDLIGTEAKSENYARLDEAIKALGDAREIQRSVWIVVVNRGVPLQIFNDLWGHLQDGDKLLVMQARPPATMQGPHADWVGIALDS